VTEKKCNCTDNSTCKCSNCPFIGSEGELLYQDMIKAKEEKERADRERRQNRRIALWALISSISDIILGIFVFIHFRSL